MVEKLTTQFRIGLAPVIIFKTLHYPSFVTSSLWYESSVRAAAQTNSLGVAHGSVGLKPSAAPLKPAMRPHHTHTAPARCLLFFAGQLDLAAAFCHLCVVSVCVGK